MSWLIRITFIFVMFRNILFIKIVTMLPIFDPKQVNVQNFNGILLMSLNIPSKIMSTDEIVPDCRSL